MRLCHRAGLSLPLLTICTVLAGCGTTTVEQPANFSQSPQVVAIYAVDSALATLPDVLIYSTIPGDSGKVSTNPPPTYGSYRVEFDQPVNGTTVANNADRGTAVGGAASFCSPLGTNPIQLVDVAGDGTRPAGVVTSSVCYDATSALGSHPHVNVVPGSGSLRSASAKPLTCNTFAPEAAAGANQRNVFKPSHQYGIKVNAATIQNAAGKSLAPPSGTGWTGDTFQFTTSGFKIMAAGYVDANTGFFVWLDKPEVGFEKDLAAVPTTYQQPADGGPFIIVLTEAITAPANPDTGGAELSGVVTLVRTHDNSNPASTAETRFNLLGDRRIIEVNTGDRYEPGQQYKVTVPAGLKADSGDLLAAGATYTFTAAAGAAENTATDPGNGAQAQSTGSTPAFEFSVPVALTGTAPAGTFTLKDANGATVPLASVSAPAGANHQVVILEPAAPLIPETTYTFSYTGVKAGTEPQGLAGAPIADGSAQFTTATFRIGLLENGTKNANGDLISIDRRTDVRPETLKDGTLNVDFNSDGASNVTPGTISLSELTGTANTPTPLSGYSVTQAVDATGAPVPGSFTVKMPATYQIKYGQKYEIRAGTAITDAVSGKKLKAEGCTLADCSDVKSFTTRKVGASIAADPSSTAPTGFVVTFTDPIDPASLNPFLTTAAKPGEFKLFARDATGALSTTPTPINCSIVDTTHVKCTAAASLGTSPASFLASAVFLQTATQDPAQGGPGGPALVAASTSTDPSAKFFGSVSANIFAACPP